MIKRCPLVSTVGGLYLRSSARLRVARPPPVCITLSDFGVIADGLFNRSYRLIFRLLSYVGCLNKFIDVFGDYLTYFYMCLFVYDDLKSYAVINF